MKWVGVLPFVVKEYRDACSKSMSGDFRYNVLNVDNTQNNIGIMRAHNLGIDYMKEHNADWLVIISAAIRFGPLGGMDFIHALEQRPDDNVVEASGVFGWHLIAFHRRTLDKIGRWDANFSPYGFCDLDMSLRIQKAYHKTPPLWEKAEVDAKDMGMAHSIKIGKVEAPADPRIEYFERKWGRHPGDFEKPSFDRPFNDPKNPIGYWPEYEGSKWDD